MIFRGFNTYYLALRKRIYILFGKRYVLRRRLGAVLLLDMLNYVDRQVEAFGCYEEEQNKFLLKSLERFGCNVFLDIGAHWGYYSIIVALDKSLPDVEVFAFEPGDVNRSQLYANLFLNNLSDKVTVFSEGVSNEAGSAGFQSHGDQNRGRSRISDQTNSTISVCTIDGALLFNDKRIGVKIDVEGHELQVLQGMERTLIDNVCFLQIESFGGAANEIEEFLKSVSYRKIFRIGNDYFYTK